MGFNVREQAVILHVSDFYHVLLLNFRNIVPFLKKYGLNPATGEVSLNGFVFSLIFIILLFHFILFLSDIGADVYV